MPRVVDGRPAQPARERPVVREIAESRDLMRLPRGRLPIDQIPWPERVGALACRRHRRLERVAAATPGLALLADRFVQLDERMHRNLSSASGGRDDRDVASADPPAKGGVADVQQRGRERCGHCPAELLLQLGSDGHDVTASGNLALGPPKADDLPEQPLLPLGRGHAAIIGKVSVLSLK